MISLCELTFSLEEYLPQPDHCKTHRNQTAFAVCSETVTVLEIARQSISVPL